MARTVQFLSLYAEPSKNGLTKPKAVRGSGIKIVNMGELYAYPRMVNIPADRAPLSPKEQNSFLLNNGDLLFARQSLVPEGAGKCSIFLGDLEAVTFESHIIRARLDPKKANPLFYYYYFRSPSGRAVVESIVEQGAGVAGIRASDLSRLEVGYLPVAEQGYIADILGSLDDKIELNRRTNETLEAMARAIFKSWFIDFDPVHAKSKGRQPDGMDAETAKLFPSSFQETEIGRIPKGWTVKKFEDFIDRRSVGKKFDNKTALPIGLVPILDQGKTGIIGFHNDEPGVIASLNEPIIVFANHTCYMRLITYSFSAIQNVLPFVGAGVDTLWAFYATQGRLSFSEYKGHWPDFVIQEAVVPSHDLTVAFGQIVKSFIATIKSNTDESQSLTAIRDALLPRLLSGEITVPASKVA